MICTVDSPLVEIFPHVRRHSRTYQLHILPESVLQGVGVYIISLCLTIRGLNQTDINVSWGWYKISSYPVAMSLSSALLSDDVLSLLDASPSSKAFQVFYFCITHFGRGLLLYHDLFLHHLYLRYPCNSAQLRDELILCLSAVDSLRYGHALIGPVAFDAMFLAVVVSFAAASSSWQQWLRAHLAGMTL